jgi:uncharacterized protein YbjT (DUF2867 family)
MTTEKRTILVTGATGLQGGAVTRHLLSNGWHVRSLTRNPKSKKAQALSALGAEVVQGDMANPASLMPIFEGAYGVFSVQNPYIGGIEGEINQGKNVAAVAKQTGVQHLVYSSAGTGPEVTGIPSWDSKAVIEAYMKSLSLPLTVLRPVAFMELMSEKKFFPAASTWHLMPKLMGSSTKVGWLSVDDIGFIAAKAFADPDNFIGKKLQLTSDVQSIDECRAAYRGVTGKEPSRFPMPGWLFERFGFVGKDLTTMWRWLREATIEWDSTTTLTIHPNALSVRAWLAKQHMGKVIP